MSYSPMPAIPPSYSPPSYSAPIPSYPPPAPLASGFGEPVPLAPLVMPEVPAAVAGTGLGGGAIAMSKFVFIPLLLLPLFLIVVLVIPVILGGGGGGGGGGGLLAKLLGKAAKKKKKEKYPYDYQQMEAFDMPQPIIDQPYYQYQRSSSEKSRNTRDTKDDSALPDLTIRQVENLTSTVFAALRSQECAQRLICEAGSLNRSFSTASTVARAVENFVPDSIKSSYDIFVSGGNCEQYACGNLVVKK